MNLHRSGKLASVVALAVSLATCMPPPPPQYVNLSDFARRAPPAGRPSYLETVKYIDDGMKYVYPAAAFFVSPDGRMCFRGTVETQQNYRFPPQEYILYNSDWCLPPTAVSRVEKIGVDQLRLFCKYENPQCVTEIGYLNAVSNSLSVQSVPSDQEKAAIEHLIYLMGGNLGDVRPF
jgi:hypothetical protein